MQSNVFCNKIPHVWACSPLHCICSPSLHYCTIPPLPEADPVVAKGMRPRFPGYQTKSEWETQPDVRPQGQTPHVWEDNLISTLLMSIICQVSPNITELHSLEYSLSAYYVLGTVQWDEDVDLNKTDYHCHHHHHRCPRRVYIPRDKDRPAFPAVEGNRY